MTTEKAEKAQILLGEIKTLETIADPKSQKVVYAAHIYLDGMLKIGYGIPLFLPKSIQGEINELVLNYLELLKSDLNNL